MPIRTLTTYFSFKLLKWLLGIFLLIAFLLFVFDLLELVRRASVKEGYKFASVALICLLRLPFLLEQVFPFVALFGSIAAFVSLNRNNELVIARSAGLSVWQFIGPAYILVLLVGILVVTAYNPMSVYLKRLSDLTGSYLFQLHDRKVLATDKTVWLRQDGPEGESVIYAAKSDTSGTILYEASIIQFNDNGTFARRIEAEKITLTDQAWNLTDATIYSFDEAPVNVSDHKVGTFLSASEARERIADPESIAFWDLPRFISLAQKAGLPAYRYTLQLHTLFSRPLLFGSMVLIAAAVSLNFSRFGGLRRMILSGIVAGFAYYILTEITSDLGGAGVIPPTFAAWSPSVVTTLLGFSILLHKEDG